MEKLREEVKQAVLDLYLWQYGGSSSFKSQLFSLMGKADTNNQSKLSEGFPVEVRVYKEWYSSESSKAFFDRYPITAGKIK